MSTSPAARTLEVRHLQIARAVLAALAAAMITFSSDHSASYGLSVFSGFTITTGLVLLISAWLVFPSGRRAPAIGLAVLDLIAGMVAGVPLIRTPELFFVVVIAWGVVTGFAEASIGWFARR
ncbi:MAG: acyl-CoA synthetase, partial [Microbacterium sp.]|nr:acyl-CoA synthetase [Microbacterium sp.]